MIKSLLRQGEMAVLLALALVILPLLQFLPVWLPLMVLCMLALRGALLRRQAAMPSLYLLLPLLLLAVGGLWLSLNTLVGREGGAALLILLLGFKSFESRQQRDWQVLLALGFFLAAMPLLFDQSPLAAVWLAISLLALTWAMLILSGEMVKGSLRSAMQALALSLPLMLVLFVVMPRLPGPLWSMPHDQHVASTGLSDSMEPGSISQLVQQQEPAFSVVFAGPAPAVSEMYWRIMIFDDFDGRRWQNVRGLGSETVQWQGGHYVSYSLTGKPAKSRLPLLEYTVAAPAGGTLEPGNLLKLARDGDELFRFQAQSLLAAHYRTVLTPADQDFYRHLPPGNPASRQLALQWRAQGGDGAGFVRAALQYFRLGGFSYTLQPPLLNSEDGIDQFMFSSRKGFCEHYASALAFMARSAGMPARIVTGYQGGQFNPVGQFWQVKSSDAHAWVEVWLAETGEWLRVDPTAAVAPDRVVQGVSQSIPAMQPQLPGLGRSMPSWLLRVQQNWQAAGFAWQQWVVGYDAGKQLNLYRWLGLGEQVDSGAVLRAVLIGGGLACLPLLLLWRRQRSGSPLQQGRQRLVQALASMKIVVVDSDGPLDILNKARRLPEPDYRQLKALLKEYAAMRYRQPARQQQAKQWLQRVKAFRPGRQ